MQTSETKKNKQYSFNDSWIDLEFCNYGQVIWKDSKDIKVTFKLISRKLTDNAMVKNEGTNRQVNSY